MNPPKHTFYFVAGLPRSGSTLLCNILAQNPQFHVSNTSGVPWLISAIRNNWDALPEFQATRNEAAKKSVMGGILENFYAGVEKPVVFDKSRTWPNLIETMEYCLGAKIKILATVRNLVDILSSLEKLHRQNLTRLQPPGEAVAGVNMSTLQGRCQFWTDGSQVLGGAYNALRDAFARGHRDRFHLVEFKDLTERPAETLAGIYAFLDQPAHMHDFEHVQQASKEDDLRYGWVDLHTIREKIEPVKPDWKTVIGLELGKLFHNVEFWRES